VPVGRRPPAPEGRPPSKYEATTRRGSRHTAQNSYLSRRGRGPRRAIRYSGSTWRVSPSTEQTRTHAPGMTTASERARQDSPPSLTLPQGVQGSITTAPCPSRVPVPTCGACRLDHQTQYRMVTNSHVSATARPTPFHGRGSRRRSANPTRSASTDSFYLKGTLQGVAVRRTGQESPASPVGALNFRGRWCSGRQTLCLLGRLTDATTDSR